MTNYIVHLASPCGANLWDAEIACDTPEQAARAFDERLGIFGREYKTVWRPERGALVYRVVRYVHTERIVTYVVPGALYSIGTPPRRRRTLKASREWGGGKAPRCARDIACGVWHHEPRVATQIAA